MPRFFCEARIEDNVRFVLDVRVAQHVRVLRLREGDDVVLFDAMGGEIAAKLVEIGKREVIVATNARIDIERELTRQITLCVGLIANDRFDWLIQKAVELGVAEIQPLYTEHSQRIPGDLGKRVAHWRGVVIAACEQSGRNRLPNVNAPISIEAAINAMATRYKILMDAHGSNGLEKCDGLTKFAVFVGPEGGFSSNELANLRVASDARLRLGETILRAETAAIASMVRVNS